MVAVRDVHVLDTLKGTLDRTDVLKIRIKTSQITVSTNKTTV